MNRWYFLLTLLSLLGCLSACQTSNRVFIAEELTEMASSDFGFSEIYFIKSVDTATALELTGTSFQNGCLIMGRLADKDRLLFVPRKTKDAILLLDFPFGFDMEEIHAALSGLKDSQNQPLYPLLLDDYGGLSIGIDQAQRITEKHPEWVLDTPIIFSFSTPTNTFFIVSANRELHIDWE